MHASFLRLLDVMSVNGVIEDKLLCAQIIFRHGSRTPLHLIPTVEEVSYGPHLFTPFKQFLDEFEIVKLRGANTMSQEDKEASSDTARHRNLKGGAPFGVLTNQGQEQLYTLGESMRKHFQKNTEFWNRIQQPGQIQARSSFFRRTIDSMKYFLLGLTGSSKHKIHVDCVTKDCMFPNGYICPALNFDPNKFYGTFRSDFELKKTRESFLNDFNIPDGNYSLLDCIDELVCRKALNLFMDDKMNHWLNQLLPLLTVEYRCLNQMLFDFQSFIKVCVGRLLLLVLQNFEKSISDDMAKDPSLYLFCGHDGTIYPLSVAFGFNDKIWPPYASYIMFELYSRFDEPYVVISYNNEVKSLNNSAQIRMPYKEFEALLGHFTCTDDEMEEFNKNR